MSEKPSNDNEWIHSGKTKNTGRSLSNKYNNDAATLVRAYKEDLDRLFTAENSYSDSKKKIVDNFISQYPEFAKCSDSDFKDVQIINDKLNCRFAIPNEKRCIPIINSRPIKRFGNKDIKDCKYIQNTDGRLSGALLIDDMWISVINGERVY